MRKALARWIVRYHVVILIAVLAVAVWSVPQIRRTHINYDLTRYLSDETMTKRALTVMKEEFGSTEQLNVMFEGQSEEELAERVREVRSLDGVIAAQFDPEQDIREQNGKAYQRIRLTLGDCDAAAMVETLRGMFSQAGTCWVGGSAAQQLDVQRSVGSEIPGVMAIAVGIVLAVLLLTGHAWLEPLVLLTVFAVSILINMGTNFVFPDVSFITFAVSAILQLALSIDYAIMLLHTWNAFCDEGMDSEAAMAEALSQCFMRILSSATTTVAGLLSLLFMSFTIGFDIGMVLSKGILISMLGVFLLMPALTLLLKKPLQKTRHRPIRLSGEKLGGLILKYRRPVAVLLVLLVLCGAYLSSRNVYTFSEPSSASGGESGMITRIFGTSNPLVLLVPAGEEDTDYARQEDLVQRLNALTKADGTPALKEITAMVTTGAAAVRHYTPSEVAGMTGMGEGLVSLFFFTNGLGTSARADRLLAAAEAIAGDSEAFQEMKSRLASARAAFIGKNRHRMLLEPAFTVSDGDFAQCMKGIFAAAEAEYGTDWYITGGPMSVYDIGNAFQGDLLKVNLITLFAILLIVIISFRSLTLPLLLVFVIEGAIWITMGISKIAGQPIFFISYLICLSIQMGATIDYGILLCDQYRMIRQEGVSAADALGRALKTALPTILTSGIILITAGYIIGKQCSIYYISSIGLLLSRGALMSVILVLTLLPALLAVFDRRIIRQK